MAERKPTRFDTNTYDPEEVRTREGKGFDVTVEQSIGRVEFNGLGKMTPREAAYILVAKHVNETGVEEARFSFPGPHEGTTEHINISLSGGPA